MKKEPVEFTSATPNPSLPMVTDVSPDELVKLSTSVHVVDVRGEDEYTGELGHIAGSQLIVLDTILDHIDTLPKDEPIVFVCRSGARSARATALAQSYGFQHVYNMQGGMILWNQLGLSTEV